MGAASFIRLAATLEWRRNCSTHPAAPCWQMCRLHGVFVGWRLRGSWKLGGGEGNAGGFGKYAHRFACTHCARTLPALAHTRIISVIATPICRQAGAVDLAGHLNVAIDQIVCTTCPTFGLAFTRPSASLLSSCRLWSGLRRLVNT